jgi:nucleotide-binding universal stress UspA family protein
VLVPLDGTPFGEHALPLAVAIARRSGAVLRLLHVHSYLKSTVDPIEIQLNSGFNYWLKQQRKSYLGEVRRRIASVSSVAAMPILHESGEEIASTIGAEANAAADLVVMATHQQRGLRRWWNGGIAASLLRETSVPLLLVRGRNTSPDLTEVPPLQRVLIPVDGSTESEEALEPALALGESMDAEYALLRPASDAPNQAWPWNAQPNHVYYEAQYAEARKYLRALSRRLGQRDRRVHWRAVREKRSIANAILWHAQTQRSDLIVLATRGRRGVNRWVQPSIADRVIRDAATPILVVRA